MISITLPELGEGISKAIIACWHAKVGDTVQQGQDWFSIVDRYTDRDARTYVQSDTLYNPWYGYGGWRPSWRFERRGFGWRTWDPFWGDPFWGDLYDVQTVQRFEASAEIIMHHGAKPAADPSGLLEARRAAARSPSESSRNSAAKPPAHSATLLGMACCMWV